MSGKLLACRKTSLRARVVVSESQITISTHDCRIILSILNIFGAQFPKSFSLEVEQNKAVEVLISQLFGPEYDHIERGHIEK